MKTRPSELYQHFDKDGTLLYVGISWSSFERLVIGHRSESRWFEDIVRVDIERFATRAEAEKAELAAIEKEKPLHNLVTRKKRGVSAMNPEWRAFIDRVKPLIEAAGYQLRGNASYFIYDSVWNSLRRGKEPNPDCLKPGVNRLSGRDRISSPPAGQ
jgi:hypothetical protein